MQLREGPGGRQLIVSATDLVGFLECGHLTVLNRALLEGLKPRPSRDDDPTLELLRRRGWQHEERYIAELEGRDRQVTRLNGDYQRDPQQRVAETLAAMRHGDDVIYQATVFDGRWLGHPDFLLRVEGPPDGRAPASAEAGTNTYSGLGTDWHYAVADTKLAHSAKASALVQICSYVDQLAQLQRGLPQHIYVVTAGAEIEEHPFRTAELMAYYRRAKARFGLALTTDVAQDLALSYPDPVEHCAVCRWFYEECRQRWRNDDALPLVAGITRKQREVLRDNGVTTMTALSRLGEPIEIAGLRRAQSDALANMREQARLQVMSKGLDVPRWELDAPARGADGRLVADRGLSALPAPSEFDLFFDIEGDPFAFWEGLEYLFGVWDGTDYRPFWALRRDQEKDAFEQVMRLFHGHWQQHPQMHVYHYGAYEPSRLRQLAGRHSTMTDELDDLLRARVFVDLYRVVRQGVRVGSERYSIKNLEPLYGFTRDIELRDANSSIVEFELYLETGSTDQRLRDEIAQYNADDCRSTEGLRDWLEARRLEVPLEPGEVLPRLQPEENAQEHTPTEWDVRLADVTAGLQATGDPRTELLASLLDFHRREDKASWWRFFELLTLTDDELLLEPEPIAGLRYEGPVRVNRAGNAVHRYSFPAQEHHVGNRSNLFDPRLPPFAPGGGRLGTGRIDKNNLTLDITRPPEWDPRSLTAVVPRDYIPFADLQQRLADFGEWVAQHGLDAAEDEFRAARDLLLARAPRVVGHDDGVDLYAETETGAEAARELACKLDATTLAIQGPPGSGKTHNGARMVLELVRDGRRVGITGSSHKVVTNLLRSVSEAAREAQMAVELLERIDAEDSEPRPWETVKDNSRLDRLLDSAESDFRVLGGTVYMWARERMRGWADTLFVDEAGQVALANVLGAAHAARNIVLLGDPRQLDQVLQGAHPPSADRSALGHFLGTEETLTRDRGVFLEKTWRMHPEITAFTSALFYEGRLRSRDGLERQRIQPPAGVEGTDLLSGAGLRWLAVEHDGNTNSSAEEADADGVAHPITAEDIVIVSPFNAHRLLIQKKLGSIARVGTVDKFQGQEAAVAIYTMASSRAEDAPRGMAFLYSLNRLNVATSRARALAIVVASPALLDAVARSPEQLRMANALCAFAEDAAGGAPDES